ncbi:hypothetical protein AB0G32_37940 [Streptomyces sp. NPDC023723]
MTASYVPIVIAGRLSVVAPLPGGPAVPARGCRCPAERAGKPDILP